jgi:hypothetical protein
MIARKRVAFSSRQLFEQLEPRTLLSAAVSPMDQARHWVQGPNLPEVVVTVVAPRVPDNNPASLVMGPTNPLVGSKATAPGQQNKIPVITPVLPPPTPAPTIFEWADPSDIGQKYYYDPAVYSLWGKAGGPVVSAGAQRYMTNCWWVAALKSEAFANPTKLMLSAKDDPRGGWDVELYGVWGHISDGFPWFSTQTTGDDALYPLVYEKAFACYKGNYNQTFGPGWPTTEIWAIGGSSDTNGSGWTAVNVAMPTTDAAFVKLINDAKVAGEGLTIGTGSYTTTLVAAHAYVITSYSVMNGVTYYHMRNPWEIDGDDKDVTLFQFQSDVAGIVGAF